MSAAVYVAAGARGQAVARRYGSLPRANAGDDPTMPKTVILGTARTPFGKLGGALSSLDATELGGHAMAAALERAEVAPEQVQHVSFGQVLQAGQGQIPSRQAQIEAGIPKEVPSETVNKVCASGIRTVTTMDTAIRAGDLEVGVAGGMESMSKAPYLLKDARFGFRMGDAKAIDAMIHDGLTNPFSGKHMAQEASEVAAELEMTRPDMDKFALRSHELAIKATDEGRLPEEIAPVTVKSKKGETVVEVDEAPRRDTSLEQLAKLPPIFVKDGSHTAGNAPGVNDGAGALVVASDEWAKKEGRQALATVVAHAQVADDFPYLARTPAKATKAALEKAGLEVDQIDLFEINEAFASVALNSMRMLGVDEDKVNVNGGAIALGHPIGASGARILGSLVHELRRRGGGIGVAAICSGGGQGDAVIVEVNGN
jgi:acetyl-CoA C-acetyltransferase